MSKIEKIITHENGTKYYYLNGALHREDGPAVEYPNGSKFWYLEDRLHREDGPAVEYPNGSKKWYTNGKLHREDGPAIEWAYGTKWWYLEGKFLSEEDWKSELEKISVEDKKDIIWDMILDFKKEQEEKIIALMDDIRHVLDQ